MAQRLGYFVATIKIDFVNGFLDMELLNDEKVRV